MFQNFGFWYKRESFKKRPNPNPEGEEAAQMYIWCLGWNRESYHKWRGLHANDDAAIRQAQGVVNDKLLLFAPLRHPLSLVFLRHPLLQGRVNARTYLSYITKVHIETERYLFVAT